MWATGSPARTRGGYKISAHDSEEGEELLEAVKAEPFLVKPNHGELERTLGRQLQDEAGVSGEDRYEGVDIGTSGSDCEPLLLLPPEPTHNLHARFEEFEHKTSEDIYNSIESDLSWIRINYGEVLIFNQNLPHGNRVNEESESRWSMNCRFKAVFSPYFDKKLGEFFRPITLRAASRIGMAYRYPRVR